MKKGISRRAAIGGMIGAVFFPSRILKARKINPAIALLRRRGQVSFHWRNLWDNALRNYLVQMERSTGISELMYGNSARTFKD